MYRARNSRMSAGKPAIKNPHTHTLTRAMCLSVLFNNMGSDVRKLQQKTFSFFVRSFLFFNKLEHVEYTCNSYKYTHTQTNEWMPNCCWINYSPQLRWLKNDFTFDVTHIVDLKNIKKRGIRRQERNNKSERAARMIFAFFRCSVLFLILQRWRGFKIGRHHHAHRMQ